jgi:hypothetical protein
MRALLLLAPIALLAACTAAPEDLPGDDGDLGSTTSLVKKGCSASRADLLAAAGGARAEAISRGFEWLDAKVPYSQKASHGGFRTDCSGFVSMCWNLKQSYTTADFAGGTANNSILGSIDDLQPGDGLVRRSGGSGHAILFVGWDDAKHTNACVLEEASTASDMQFGLRAVSSLKSQGFKAMRKDGMPDAQATAVTDDGPAPTKTTSPTTADDDDLDVDVDDDTTDPTAPATVPLPAPRLPQQGDPCTSTDTCNPLTSGTGLLCSPTTSRCVPGCEVDLHCPGRLLCKAGRCSM